MNFTNKDFHARIITLDQLNLPVRESVQKIVDAESSRPKRNLTEERSVPRNQNQQTSSSSLQIPLPFQPNPPIALPASNSSSSGCGENNDKTINTTSSNNSHNTCVIVAITEGRGYSQGEIGLASLDINSPTLILSQICDAFWYRDILLKLEILQPVEIITPWTIYNSGSKLLDRIQVTFPDLKITPIPRRHFTDDGTLILIEALCTSDCKSSLNAIGKKYYAVSAATGLLKYLKSMMLINFVPNGLRVEYQTRLSRLFVDFETYHRLELLYSLANTKEKRCCLFGFLDNTVTAVGSRCLRAYILEPFCNLSNIFDTQNCIKELLDNPELLELLQEGLKNFANCDQLIKLCLLPPDDDKVKSIEIMLNKILLLKTTLANLPLLRNTVSRLKSKIFCKIFKVLADKRFEIMITDIQEVVQPEIDSIKRTAQCFQRIYAIRSGVNKYLDLMRKVYSELSDTIRSTICELATKFHLPLRMTYSIGKGFHMQLTSTVKNPITTVPPQLEILYRRGNNFFLITPELFKLNVQMTEVIEEMHIASHITARKLLEKIATNADATYDLVGAISNLDIILSLAKVSARDGYCCPTFGSETRIIDGIYPFLEYSSSRPTSVPNNIIGTPDYNFFIITGPNMGGKTIYIKTIAILQIMAQLGCYVPAKIAQFRICDRIFTRMGFEDRVEADSSSYVVEMREVEYIFNNVTPNSLVIIDELCRNTNPDEGKQIAFKICEKMAGFRGIKNTGEYHQENEHLIKPSVMKSLHSDRLFDITSPFIYLTTHFMELTKLADNYHNISNLHVHAEEDFINDKLHLTYTHKVMEGVTPITGYGLALARTIRFPQGILERAEQIYEELLTKETNKYISPKTITKISIVRDPIFQNLHSTLSFVSQDCPQRAGPPGNLIRSFVSNSISNESSTQSVNETIRTEDVLEDFNNDLYDLYSSIASITRNETNNSSAEFEALLNGFISRQSEDLLRAIGDLNLESGMENRIVDSQMPPPSIARSFTKSDVLNEEESELLSLPGSYRSFVQRRVASVNETVVPPTDSSRIQRSMKNPQPGPSISTMLMPPPSVTRSFTKSDKSTDEGSELLSLPGSYHSFVRLRAASGNETLVPPTDSSRIQRSVKDSQTGPSISTTLIPPPSVIRSFMKSNKLTDEESELLSLPESYHSFVRRRAASGNETLVPPTDSSRIQRSVKDSQTGPSISTTLIPPPSVIRSFMKSNKLTDEESELLSLPESYHSFVRRRAASGNETLVPPTDSSRIQRSVKDSQTGPSISTTLIPPPSVIRSFMKSNKLTDEESELLSLPESYHSFVRRRAASGNETLVPPTDSSRIQRSVKDSQTGLSISTMLIPPPSVTTDEGSELLALPGSYHSFVQQRIANRNEIVVPPTDSSRIQRPVRTAGKTTEPEPSSSTESNNELTNTTTDSVVSAKNQNQNAMVMKIKTKIIRHEVKRPKAKIRRIWRKKE